MLSLEFWKLKKNNLQKKTRDNIIIIIIIIINDNNLRIFQQDHLSILIDTVIIRVLLA